MARAAAASTPRAKAAGGVPSAAGQAGTVAAMPQGCSNLRLRQLMRRLDQHYDAEMAKAGLRTTQYSLLSAVVKLEPVSPGALARTLKLQASTLTRNLQPLIAAGWVALGAGSDARTRSIASTPAGRAKRAEAARHWKQAQLRLNDMLGVPRVAALHQLIDECMGRLADGGPATEAEHPDA